MMKDVIFWILVYASFTAMVASFLLLLAYKIGIVECLQTHGNDLFSKMAGCDFCMLWWLSVAVTIVIVAVTGNWHFVFIPIVSTPIARRLI